VSPPFVGPANYVPVLSSMAGVASPVCLPGIVTRNPVVTGHPLSELAERSLAARGVNSLLPTDGAASGASSTVARMFNLSKLSAQLGVSEHGN